MSMPRLNQTPHRPLPVVEVTRVNCTSCGHSTLSLYLEDGVCTSCLLAEDEDWNEQARVEEEMYGPNPR